MCYISAMLKRLPIIVALVVIALTLSPEPGRASTSSGYSGSKTEDQGQNPSKPPAQTPPRINSQVKAVPTDSDVDSLAGKNAEHSVKLTSLPPVTVALADKAKTCWDYLFDWGPWIFALGLVAIGVFQTHLLIRQEEILRGARNEIQTQALHLSRQADLMSRNNVITLANARSAQQATEHLITSNRAWFVCRANMKWDRRENGEIIIRISFVYENIGKTPGFITEVGFAVIGLSEKQNLPQVPQDYGENDQDQWTEGRGLPIAPGDNMGRKAKWVPTQPELEKWKRGELVIWIHGRVEYRDSFVEQRRETRYCLRVKPRANDTSEAEFVLDGPPAYNSAT